MKLWEELGSHILVTGVEDEAMCDTLVRWSEMDANVVQRVVIFCEMCDLRSARMVRSHQMKVRPHHVRCARTLATTDFKLRQKLLSARTIRLVRPHQELVRPHQKVVRPHLSGMRDFFRFSVSCLMRV